MTITGLNETAAFGTTNSEASGTNPPSSLEAQLAVLPFPPRLQDPLAMLEALMVELNVQERSESRGLYDQAIQRLEAQGAAEVRALRKMADDVWKEGLLSGGGQILGGAARAYGGISALGSLSGPTPAPDQTANAKLQTWTGIGGVVEGTGNLWGSWYAARQQDHQAEASAAGTQQQVAEQVAGQAASDANASRIALQGLLRMIEQIHEKQDAATMAVVQAMR